MQRFVAIIAAAASSSWASPSSSPWSRRRRRTRTRRPRRPARAAARPPSVTLQQLPFTFDQPLYVTAPPGDTTRLFVVEKTGAIRVIKNGALLPAPFLDISGLVSGGGEQGLLSMAFDPEYASNRRFYVDYTNANGDTRVVRYLASAADPDVAAPSSARVLLRVDQPYDNHNGGQLQFGPDGRLYVGMGDGGSGGDPQGRAQNMRSRLGKMLRLNVNVSPVSVQHLREGAAQPMALLVRPQDRSPVDRRRRPERLGGDRLPAPGAARRSQLRLERLRGHARLRRASRGPAPEVVAHLARDAVRPQPRVTP